MIALITSVLFGVCIGILATALYTKSESRPLAPNSSAITINKDKEQLDCISTECNLLKEQLKKQNHTLHKLRQENLYLLSISKAEQSKPVEDYDYSEIFNKIDTFPESLISNQLEKIISEENIKSIGNIRTFSKKLAQVALDTQDGLDNTGIINITFSTSPVYGKDLLTNKSNVKPTDTIFAHIFSSGISQEVIVKWQHLQTNEILLFKNKYISDNQNIPSIWLRQKEGWRKGSYRVSIHTLDDQVTPIGSNSYTINEIDNSGNTHNSIIEDLINSGQAVKKRS